MNSELEEHAQMVFIGDHKYSVQVCKHLTKEHQTIELPLIHVLFSVSTFCAI